MEIPAPRREAVVVGQNAAQPGMLKWKAAERAAQRPAPVARRQVSRQQRSLPKKSFARF
jgi:hypothetical protein